MTTEKAEPVAWRRRRQRGDQPWKLEPIYGDAQSVRAATIEECAKLAESLARFDPRSEKNYAKAIRTLSLTKPAQARPRCDAQSEALDNSQSLLVMMIELSREGSIPPLRWINEGLSRLLEKQVAENRSALSETKPL